MSRQLTEMLKGTMEGLVPAILSGRPAHGYEITAWLRDQGFADIAEGTVYAVLEDLELPRRTAPPASQRRQVDVADEPKSRYLQYLEIVTGSLEEKKRYRQCKTRIKQLPDHYRTAVEALERYLMHFGPADGSGAMAMYEDLADLFEQSAADRTPIRDIFGDDPVEFVEAFMANYPLGQYRTRERDHFTSAVERAAEEDRTK